MSFVQQSMQKALFSYLSIGRLLGVMLFGVSTFGHAEQVIQLVQPPDSSIGLQRFARTGDARYLPDLLYGYAQPTKDVYSASLSAHKALGLVGKTWVIWDTNNGKILHHLKHLQGPVQRSAFSADGAFLLTIEGTHGDRTVFVWDALQGTPLFNMPAWDATFSPDGKNLAVLSAESAPEVWDIDTHARLFSLSRGSVYHAAFSADGKVLATAGGDNHARIWDAHTGMLLHTLAGHKNEVRQVAISADSKHIVTSSIDNTARVWEVATGKLVQALQGHTASVLQATFSPDGKQLATTSQDRTVAVWGLHRETPVAVFAYERLAWTVAFSADGQRVLASADDGTIQVWNVATKKRLAVLPTAHTGDASVRSATFDAPDRLFTIGSDDIAQAWYPVTGQQRLRVPGELRIAALSPDGARLVTVPRDYDLKDAQLRDGNGTLLHTLEQGTYLHIVQFDPDGRQVLAAGADGKARLWDVETGLLSKTFTDHTGDILATAFSPDGAFICTGSADQTARLWNAKTGNSIHAFQGHTGTLIGVVFSADGTRVATTSMDGTARVWDVKTGACLAVLHVSQGTVMTAAFRGDGALLATTDEYGRVCVWHIGTGKELYAFSPTAPAKAVRFVGDALQVAHNDYTVSTMSLPVFFHQLSGFAGFGQRVTPSDVITTLFASNAQVACQQEGTNDALRCKNVRIGNNLQAAVNFVFNNELLQKVVLSVTPPEGVAADELEAALRIQQHWLAASTGTQSPDVAALAKVRAALNTTDVVSVETTKSPVLTGTVRREGTGSNARFFVEMTYTLPSS